MHCTKEVFSSIHSIVSSASLTILWMLLALSRDSVLIAASSFTLVVGGCEVGWVWWSLYGWFENENAPNPSPKHHKSPQIPTNLFPRLFHSSHPFLHHSPPLGTRDGHGGCNVQEALDAVTTRVQVPAEVLKLVLQDLERRGEGVFE